MTFANYKPITKPTAAPLHPRSSADLTLSAPSSSTRGVAARPFGVMAFLRSIKDFIVGDSSMTIGDGRFCVECLDCHPTGACPRTLIGHCQDCDTTRTLDRFGNCATCGSRSVSLRRHPRLYVVPPNTTSQQISHREVIQKTHKKDER